MQPASLMPLHILLLLPLITQAQVIQNILVAGSKPPAGFKFQLGTWFNDPETTQSWNAKFGRKFPTFQAAQSIPYGVNGSLVILDPDMSYQSRYLDNVAGWQDGTDASVFMTIYADRMVSNGSQGLDLVSADAITHLATRLNQITQTTGRKVMMRWLPEMNGDWMLYGKQAAAYVEKWKLMYNIFNVTAPNVQIVWSPNFDLQPGDTSYWPGPEYVHMVGTSSYFKGWGTNSNASVNYVASAISTVYNEYARKYNKPFVISECSGAWESGPGRSPVTGETFTNVTSLDTQPEFQQAFWAGILNPAFFAAFPLTQAAYIFEIAKQEEFFTDFRLTNDSATFAAFQALVNSVDSQGYLVWANDGSSTSSTTTTTSTTTASTFATTAISAAITPSASPTKSGARTSFAASVFSIFSFLFF
ncbi:glycoside hydrolase superfamily [Chytriomyces sp. MP71]|nr:glycoside hydrolase superfamily [Chytriomyces sp. MP71]